MKKLLLLITVASVAFAFALKPEGTTYLQEKSGSIKFFSTAPLEDITAINKGSSAILKSGDGYLKVIVPIRKFEFEKDLMYQHFLEKKYMWAEKYPEAEFKGNITNLADIDFTKNGTYDATVKGTLTIRGVAKEYETSGTVTIAGAGDLVQCHSVFKVRLEDHKVPVPKMVVDNIAEEVELTIDLELPKYVKK